MRFSPQAGIKVHILECLECALAVAAFVERDEPLIHRAKNHGSLGAPAMRVAVGDGLVLAINEPFLGR